MRDGWEPTALGRVARQVVEPVAIDGRRLYSNLGVKWYAAGTFLREPKLGSEIKATRLYRVRPGQFVYNRLFATEGSFALVRPEDEGAVASNEFPVFDVDRERLLPEYLALHFQQPSVWHEVHLECTGTTKSRLRWKEERFAAHTVLLPRLREQWRIVDLIGALDDALAAAEASAAATDALSQRARDALPDGTIRPIGEVLTGIESGTSTKPVGGDGEKVFVLTLAAIRPGRFHRSEIKDVGAAALPTKARLVESDLLITRSNTPDRVGYVCVARDVPDNTYIPDLVWRLVTDESHVTKDYLEQALSSTRLREAITRSASGTSQSMRKINKAGFARIQVPIPGIEVQGEYVAPLRQLAGVRAEYDSHLARLRVLRSNMLAALLSGEHEIPNSYDELMEVAS